MIDEDTWFPHQLLHNQWMQKTVRHLNICKKYVTNFKCAIDCGAHYGTWAVSMAKEFGQVVAIEGRKDLFDCLYNNTFNVPNIDCKHAAIGDEQDRIVEIGIIPKWEGSANSGVACIVGENNDNETVKVFNEVSMITIDSLNLDSVGFIKLDIEGYEQHALRGAEQTLLAHKPVIIFEEMKGQCTQFGVPMGDTGKYLDSL